jgi:hypothetical protein
MRFIGLAVLIATAAPTPIMACEFDGPFVPKLSNESAADREGRIERAYDDAEVIREYSRQTSNFASANAVYLGEIIRSSQSDSGSGIRTGIVSVKPLASFKGAMPNGEVNTFSAEQFGSLLSSGRWARAIRREG